LKLIAEEKREERTKERLDSYYKRNYKVGVGCVQETTSAGTTYE